MQTSESFRLSALLSFSGGLQDAYTYNVRGHVFANAQTGNVVLMSQNFMTGNWRDGLHYMLPLISFALGILIAERVENRFKNAKNVHWRQIVLIMEIVMLCAVGFMPAGLNMVANMLVSLSCAMQVQSFRTVHGYGYASTMCIGNLRSGTESLSKYLRDRDRESLRKALNFFGIIAVFALGAGAGGVISGYFGAGTIWLSVILLAAVMLMMLRETR
ncbi:MAG: YoaK family protein [Ruminococcus sp.]|nr:YoaK family protein [Ruminococcus sp.]